MEISDMPPSVCQINRGQSAVNICQAESAEKWAGGVICSMCGQQTQQADSSVILSLCPVSYQDRS